MKVLLSALHRNVPRIATACSVVVGAMLFLSLLFATSGGIWALFLAGLLGVFPFILVRFTLTKWNEAVARSVRINAARDRTDSCETTRPRKRQLAPVPIQEVENVILNGPKLCTNSVRMRVNTAHGWVIREVEVFEPQESKTTGVSFEIGAHTKACVERVTLPVEQPTPLIETYNAYPRIEAPENTVLPSGSADELPLIDPLLLTNGPALVNGSRGTYVRRSVETEHGWVVKEVEPCVPRHAETAVPPSPTEKPKLKDVSVVELQPVRPLVLASDVMLLLASLRALVRKKQDTEHAGAIGAGEVFEPPELVTKASSTATSLTRSSGLVETEAASPHLSSSLVRRRVDTARGWVIEEVEEVEPLEPQVLEAAAGTVADARAPGAPTTASEKATRSAEGGPSPFRLNLARIAEVQAETGRVDSLLAGIFNADACQPQQAAALTFVIESATERSVLGLDGAHSALVRKMLLRPQWSREELRGIVDSLDLMLDGALECVNEAAFDIHEIPFSEGVDLIEVNPNIVGLLS